jgi:flagellar FliJ protein
MKGFRFNLQKVLRLREYREREAEIALGRAVGVLTEIENKIALLAQDRIAAAERRFSGGAREMISYERYIFRLDTLRDRLFNEAAMAELKVAEARDLYLEASRDRKVLDKLKEHRRREYRRGMEREEIRITDDISSGVRARQAVLGG